MADNNQEEIELSDVDFEDDEDDELECELAVQSEQPRKIPSHNIKYANVVPDEPSENLFSKHPASSHRNESCGTKSDAEEEKSDKLKDAEHEKPTHLSKPHSGNPESTDEKKMELNLVPNKSDAKSEQSLSTSPKRLLRVIPAEGSLEPETDATFPMCVPKIKSESPDDEEIE
ncbi:unnamed protein product, partial [Thelazia callipaeda]|uniref:BLVR domain-containing protein n=1 Tax=Thelazia callipaeda TaxID=103827 RepID=A0A0N5CT67_THECL